MKTKTIEIEYNENYPIIIMTVNEDKNTVLRIDGNYFGKEIEPTDEEVKMSLLNALMQIQK